MSGLSLLATFIVVQFDFMQRIFDTAALDLNQWLVCLALGSIVLWVVEIMKIFRRRAAARAEASVEATVTTEPAPAVSATTQGD
jgi:hypothetical protein